MTHPLQMPANSRTRLTAKGVSIISAWDPPVYARRVSLSPTPRPQPKNPTTDRLAGRHRNTPFWRTFQLRCHARLKNTNCRALSGQRTGTQELLSNLGWGRVQKKNRKNFKSVAASSSFLFQAKCRVAQRLKRLVVAKLLLPSRCCGKPCNSAPLPPLCCSRTIITSCNCIQRRHAALQVAGANTPLATRPAHTSEPGFRRKSNHPRSILPANSRTRLSEKGVRHTPQEHRRGKRVLIRRRKTVGTAGSCHGSAVRCSGTRLLHAASEVSRWANLVDHPIHCGPRGPENSKLRGTPPRSKWLHH